MYRLRPPACLTRGEAAAAAPERLSSRAGHRYREIEIDTVSTDSTGLCWSHEKVLSFLRDSLKAIELETARNVRSVISSKPQRYSFLGCK